MDTEQRCDVLDFEAIRPKIVQFPVYRESFYCFIIVEDGETVIAINGIRQSVGPKTVICGLPGEIWEWEKNPVIKGKTVIFEPDFITSSVIDPFLLQRPGFLHPQSRNPFIPVSDEGFQRISNIISEMMKEVSSPVKFYDLFRVQLWHLILLIEKEFRQINSINSALSSRNYAICFINLVGVDLYRHHDVEYYAERLCITTNYLNKISHSAFGVSAREYIQDRIISEAKNLLDITGMNVSEISNTLGFNTPNYFIRFFKKQTGVTPKEFRNKGRQMPSQDAV